MKAQIKGGGRQKHFRIKKFLRSSLSEDSG